MAVIILKILSQNYIYMDVDGTKRRALSSTQPLSQCHRGGGQLMILGQLMAADTSMKFDVCTVLTMFPAI